MLKKIISYLLGGIGICYAMFALFVTPNIPDKNLCRGVLIDVANDNNGNLTEENINEMLNENGLAPIKKEMEKIDCHEMEKFLSSITLVRDCQVYKGKTGYINIDIECRTPIMKVHENNGRSYYIDAAGDTIVGIHKALHLPVASGHITRDMRKNELRDIANTIYNNPFWRAQIEQVYFNAKGEIILVPRVGDHIIEFGKTDHAAEKLSKLYTFYSKGLNTIGWDKYEKLNIEFNDKVIGTRKNK